MIYFKRFLFFVMPVAATVDLMVSRIGPIVKLFFRGGIRFHLFIFLSDPKH